MYRIATVLMILLLSSCSHTHPSFVGSWECDHGRSGAYVWNVTQDQIEMEFQGEGGSLGYSIDHTQSPIWLDLHRPGKDPMCIIEFVDKDTFRVTGLDETESRPKTFPESYDTLVFKRMR